MGVAGVEVELADAESGLVLATTTTDDDGYYLFDDLEPGTYVVRIPASSLGAGGPLNGFASSDAFDPTDPDDDPTDMDDQGAEVGAVIESAPITLLNGYEPVGETDAGPLGSGTAGDTDSNLTVDFGFYRIPQPTSGSGTSGGPGISGGGVPAPAQVPTTSNAPAPTFPLALTGGNRQLHQLLLSLGLLGVGSLSMALGRGRRRRSMR